MHRQVWKPGALCISSYRLFRSVVFIALGGPFLPEMSSVRYGSSSLPVWGLERRFESTLSPFKASHCPQVARP